MWNKNMVYKLVFLLLLRFTQIRAFSWGPPLRSCESMKPRHRGSSPQLGASPYDVIVSKSSYTPGENLTVTISGSTTFKGYMLQVQSSNSSIAWPVGEFVQIPDGAQTIFCSGGEPTNTIGHYNPNGTDLYFVNFTWKAPTKSAGNIAFIATIVQSYDTYWVKVSSSLITGPAAENITKGVSPESFKIDKVGCGKTKGCYSLPPKCNGSADCDYLFTYQVFGGNVTFEMSAKERYVSVAFNEEKLMDKMDSILCVTMATNYVELRHYSSKRHLMERRSLVGNNDISLEGIVYEDGVINCRFTRKLTSDATYFKDLRKELYILFAHGKTTPVGTGLNHRRNRTFTPEKVDLAVPAILIDQQSQVKDTITKEGCGETKSCYSEPENCKASSNCDYLVTIKPLRSGDEGEDVEEVEFEISANRRWTSIGFNKNKKMPGADAIVCSVGYGGAYVNHYVADQGYGTPTKTIPRPSSLIPILTDFTGGVVSCRFRRKMQDPKMMDLTEPVYLVYTSGPTSHGSIRKHSTDPKTSAEKVKIDEIVILGAVGKDFSKIKAHGCLMVIAWIGFASIAIFMARYTKVAFGEKQLLGTKVWFTFHRALMILTVLFTVISTIVIFVDAGRWTDEAGAHPYAGIIVLVLAVINVIVPWFRPHPGKETRYIFNWAHRGVGLSSLVMAVVTIFLGIRLDGVGLDNAALYAMIAYCLCVAIMIAFDVHLTLNKDYKYKTIYRLERDAKKDHHVQSIEDSSIPARRVMLGFLVLFVFSVVLALVVQIATATAQDHNHH